MTDSTPPVASGEAVSEATSEATSEHYQRALDLEAMGMMGVDPDEKYRREVGAVFEGDPWFSALPAGASVLDVACGRGNTSFLLDGRGFSVTGVDASEPAIREAIGSFAYDDNRTHFKVGDMKNPPHKEGGYDAVTCLGRSLAYFKTYEEYVEVLRNWRDVLKSGGKVAIEWTEWVDGADGDSWQSLDGVQVISSDEKTFIQVPGTQERVDYGPEVNENFKYPGGQLPNAIRYGGRIYTDPQGEKHDFGEGGSFFVDLLKQRNFSLIQRMLQEAGFVNVRLIEAPQPLTPPGQPKTVKIFAVTAEKPSDASLQRVGADARARFLSWKTGLGI